MLILKKYFSFIQSENAPFISKKCKSKEKAITNYFQKKKKYETVIKDRRKKCNQQWVESNK